MVYSFGNYYHIYLLLKEEVPRDIFITVALSFPLVHAKESSTFLSHLVQEWHSVRRKMTTYPSPLWMTKYPNILHTYLRTSKYTLGSKPFWSKFFHLPRLHDSFHEDFWFYQWKFRMYISSRIVECWNSNSTLSLLCGVTQWVDIVFVGAFIFSWAWVLTIESWKIHIALVLKIDEKSKEIRIAFRNYLTPWCVYYIYTIDC